MRYYTGNAKLDWNVYSGQKFQDDDLESDEIEIYPLNYNHVAEELFNGKIIAWARGNAEIGPRALGNRSILAAPFTKTMLNRINAIKGREEFRPVAPICIQEDVSLHFEWYEDSPYMLFFQRVIDKRLEAITHIDGTARVQTVTENSNNSIWKLLHAFKKKSKVGVLCNTSLNFHGMGFINRTSDLLEYVKKNNLDGFVAGEKLYMMKKI